MNDEELDEEIIERLIRYPIFLILWAFFSWLTDSAFFFWLFQIPNILFGFAPDIRYFFNKLL